MALLGGGERDLTIKLLANVSDFKKNMNSAENTTKDFGSKTGDVMKKVGVAFAAAAAAAVAYAGKLIVDGVKAAIEDEAAQARLAQTLRNVAGATDESIAAVERQILATSLATGVADDKLRPAYSRLAIATGDTAKANDLLKLSMDISAATGKDLETVTSAVGKAYEGNTASLAKLGVGISATDITALGFEGTMAKLNEKFGGAAQAQAETFEGKMARLKVAFDEAKESVGAALLPVLSEMFEFVTRNLVPIFQKLSDDFNQNVRPALERLWAFIKENVLPIFVALGKFIFEELVPTYRDFLKPIIEQIIGIFERLFERIQANKQAFETLGQTLDKLWFFIQNYIIPIFTFLIEYKLKEIERGFRAFAAVLDFVIEKFEILKWLIPSVAIGMELAEKAWNASGAAAKYAAEQNQGLADQYRDFNNQATSEYIPTIDDFSSVFDDLTGSTDSATNATTAFTAATRQSTEAVQAQFTALQSLDLMRAGFASAVGGVLQLGSANIPSQLPNGESFQSAAQIIGQFGGLIPGFNAKPSDPFYGFTQGDTLGSFVRPSTNSNAGNSNVTINVNGTVLDPEGVARAVSDVLVRSGGRAGNLPLGDLLGVA